MLGFEKTFSGLYCGTKQQETHQKMRDPNVTSLYSATALAFYAPTEGFPWGTIFVKFCTEGQRTAKIQNDEEILPKISTTAWAGCTNVANDRRICDSEDPKVQTHAVYGTAYSEYSSDNTVIMLILYRCVELNWGLRGVPNSAQSPLASPWSRH